MKKPMFRRIPLGLRASRALALALVAAGAFLACANDDSTPDTLSASDDAGSANEPAMTRDSGAATDADDVEPDADSSTSTPTCGNRKIEEGEECDDGNKVNNDGCSSVCVIESRGASDVCPGETIALTQVDDSTMFTAHVSASTATLYNHFGSNCGGGSAPDAVYAFVAPKLGRAKVTVNADYNVIVSARTTKCNDTKMELSCIASEPVADSTVTLGNGAVSTYDGDFTFPVDQGQTFYVFVDGNAATSGDFVLDIAVETAVCGNGTGESPEECDDGNTIDGDGCSSKCKLEMGGNIGACPGKGIRLPVGTMGFTGDTSVVSGTAYTATGCSPTGSGPSAIYALTPTVSGNLSVNLLTNYATPVIFARRECADSATQYDCTTAVDARTPMALTMPVTAEETVYIFVDGTSSGLYTLHATLTAGACGSGKLDSGEECDDGNLVDGDGCSSTCTVERDPTTFTCPGKALALTGTDATTPRTLKVSGTTKPATGSTLPASKFTSCTSLTCNPKVTCGSAAPDVVYQVTSDIDGYLTATVSGQFNASVSVRDACAGSTVEYGCSRAQTGNSPKTTSVAINKNTPYTIIVDGYATANSGTFELALEVRPSVCGNGIIEGGETCDDGAVADGDGCTSACKLDTDVSRDECSTAALIDVSSLTYDLVGGTTNLTKPASVTHTMVPCSSNGPDGHWPFIAPINGVATFTLTSATYLPAIGVTVGCGGTQLACSGSNAEAGTEITFPITQGATYDLMVGGVNISTQPKYGRFTGTLKIVPAGCGDGIQSGGEECEDGNTLDGDGCSSKCALVPLPGIAACPGAAVAMTGTGKTQRIKTVTVDTRTLSSNTSALCGGSGPEGILAVTSDVDGWLDARTLRSDFDTILYSRNTCSSAASEYQWSTTMCSSANIDTTRIPVYAGTPAYVFVDGIDGASGVAKVQLTVTP